jgi:hypothetical protein
MVARELRQHPAGIINFYGKLHVVSHLYNHLELATQNWSLARKWKEKRCRQSRFPRQF